MFKGKKIVGIIPARGGSKRLPRKNILTFCGRPLIAWTIGQAKKSRYLDDVVVSTDDKATSRISERYGASVPFSRPARLSSDRAKTIDVLIHAIDRLEREDRRYDIIVLLQPTSPLRNTADIDKAIELLFKKKSTAIVSVCRAEHNPLWSGTLQRGASMNKFFRNARPGKTGRDSAVYYRLNGAVYVIYADHLRRTKSFYKGKTIAYVMPKSRSIDIDDKFDFKVAESFALQS